jgi:hypothetical protein
MGWVPRHPAPCLIQYGLSRNLIPIELHVSIIVHWKRVTPVRCTHSTVVNALLLCSLTYLLETSYALSSCLCLRCEFVISFATSFTPQQSDVIYIVFRIERINLETVKGPYFISFFGIKRHSYI